MLIFLYRYLKGYLHIRLDTNNPERFLNLCSANGIEIWKSTFKSGKLYFKTSIKSFKSIRQINSRFKGKVHIVSKVGIPFFVFRNKSRYGFLIGFILFFTFLNVMSNFIWNIEIVGASKENVQKIENGLEEIGITEGKKISEIDTKTLRNELLLSVKELAWAAINIEGTTVTIDVTETTKKDYISTEPSNIKAEYDGIIRSVEAIKGTPMVAVGQAVRKGDLLISGVVEFADLHTELVRARGTVMAEIEETISVSQSLKINEFLRTGEEKKRTVIEFFGIKIPLYFGDISESYEYDKSEKEINIWDKGLPIKIITKTFYLTEERERYFSVLDARTLAEQSLSKNITKFVGNGKIISKKITEKTTDDTLELIAEIKCEKNIVLEEKLLIGTRNQ